MEWPLRLFPRSISSCPIVYEVQRFRLPFRVIRSVFAAVVAAAVSAFPAAAATADISSVQPAFAFGIPLDFILFALTLIGVAVFHPDPPHERRVELPTIHAHVMMGDVP